MARILLIDDDRSLREVIAFILTEAGHEVVTAADGDAGIAAFAEQRPDLVLTDMRMPGQDGMAVLRQVREAERQTPPPVIILTAHGSVEQAVEAMKLGAFTYILKPFDRDELRLTVEQALHTRYLETDNRNLRELLRQKNTAPTLIYRSASMTALMEQLRQTAPTEATILVSGESGTGKELVARACHDLSPRWDHSFVAVNCGAIPADLLESELFGHAKGAFTGATRSAPGRFRSAEGGSLFLDEIGDLPISLQPKLLRVLETKQVDPVGSALPVSVDFRLICATNRDLEQAVREGTFREDLYYRLAIIRLHLPPLRSRPDDLPLLWEHFTRQNGGPEVRSESELLTALALQPWRGNIRELQNLNQRMVLLRKSDLLTVADLDRAAAADFTPPLEPIPGSTGAPAVFSAAPESGLPLGPLPELGFSLPELEKEVVRQALARCGGNKSRTAAYLGIPRHVLVYRLVKYGL
ncbi:MAG: sigma-54 dependent transcriptional regulator [bacterium]